MGEEQMAARAWPSLAPATPQRAGKETHRAHPTSALADVALRQAVMTLGADLAAVQARLAALETTISPEYTHQHRAAPGRRAGSLTNLAPLSGCTPAPPIAPPAALTTPSPTQRPGWRDWGQAILVVALLLVVFTWLLRPTARGKDAAQPTVPVANMSTAPAAGAAVGAPVVATPAECFAPAGAAGEECVSNTTAAAAPPSPAAVTIRWTVALEATPLCNWDNPATTCSLDPPRTTMTIVIQAGDEVEWRVRAGHHTVTFPATGTPVPQLYLPAADAAGMLNPLAAEPHGGAIYDGAGLVGSGLLDEHSPPYRLTFPQPGRYAYVDLGQPALIGQVIVLPGTDQTLAP